jgi:hypothetical protein
VTGRTQREPAAEIIVRNLLEHVDKWKPAPHRKVSYVGEPAGKCYLQDSGLIVNDYAGGKLSADELLIAGPGAGATVAGKASDLAEWIKAGGNVLAVALDQADIDALLPFKVGMKRAVHISTLFSSTGQDSPLAGVGPAEVHNRDPREMPLVSSGAQVLGDGVLAHVNGSHVVLCQLAPWHFAGEQANLRRTRRHTAVLFARLLANLGAAAPTPLLERFHRPADTKSEQRWLTGFYQDQPEEWDDPYRFFRW